MDSVARFGPYSAGLIPMLNYAEQQQTAYTAEHFPFCNDWHSENSPSSTLIADVVLYNSPGCTEALIEDGPVL